MASYSIDSFSFNWEWHILPPSSFYCPSFSVEGKKQTGSSHLNEKFSIEYDTTVSTIHWINPDTRASWYNHQVHEASVGPCLLSRTLIWNSRVGSNVCLDNQKKSWTNILLSSWLTFVARTAVAAEVVEEGVEVHRPIQQLTLRQLQPGLPLGTSSWQPWGPQEHRTSIQTQQNGSPEKSSSEGFHQTLTKVVLNTFVLSTLVFADHSGNHYQLCNPFIKLSTKQIRNLEADPYRGVSPDIF